MVTDMLQSLVFFVLRCWISITTGGIDSAGSGQQELKQQQSAAVAVAAAATFQTNVNDCVNAFGLVEGVRDLPKELRRLIAHYYLFSCNAHAVAIVKRYDVMHHAQKLLVPHAFGLHMCCSMQSSSRQWSALRSANARSPSASVIGLPARSIVRWIIRIVGSYSSIGT